MCGGGGHTDPDNRQESSKEGTATGQNSAGDGSDDDDCRISEATELASPNSEALEDAPVGEMYPVEERDGRLCVIDDDDRIIGSITGQLAEKLLECIELGHNYKAEILKIEGRKCQVRISNRCQIDSKASLTSPNPDPLSQVSEGDVLKVEAQNGSLCAVDDQNRTVGAIAKPWTKILINCIKSGLEYKARIIKIDGGDCRVRVTNNIEEE